MNYDYFIASRWRNKDAVMELTEKLREKGKSVYCFFETEGEEHETWKDKHHYTPEEFMQKFENTPDWQHDPAIQKMFTTDMDALKNSKSLILLLPAGKSAHVEAGAAYGMGKHCILIGEQKEAESLYLIFKEFHSSIDNFIAALN